MIQQVFMFCMAVISGLNGVGLGASASHHFPTLVPPQPKRDQWKQMSEKQDYVVKNIYIYIFLFITMIASCHACDANG